MARVIITIEDDEQSGGVRSQLEAEPSLPDKKEDASLAQIVGVGTYHLMSERLDLAQALVGVLAETGASADEIAEALKNAPTV